MTVGILNTDRIRFSHPTVCYSVRELGHSQTLGRRFSSADLSHDVCADKFYVRGPKGSLSFLRHVFTKRWIAGNRNDQNGQIVDWLASSVCDVWLRVVFFPDSQSRSGFHCMIWWLNGNHESHSSSRKYQDSRIPSQTSIKTKRRSTIRR